MIDKKWYLNVVLICISLIVKLEIFFICLKMIEILLSAVYVSFVHFSIEFWFLFSWLLSVLLWTCLWYILQILTTSLIVVFWLCLWCLPGEGNGSPFQYSCLENPRDRGACWAAVYGVAKSRTWLKWLGSRNSSSSMMFARLPWQLSW